MSLWLDSYFFKLARRSARKEQKIVVQPLEAIARRWADGDTVRESVGALRAVAVC